jgi:hypothetical protein
MVSESDADNRIAEYAATTLDPTSENSRNPRAQTCWTEAYKLMAECGAINTIEQARLGQDTENGSAKVLGESRNKIADEDAFLATPPGKVIAFVNSGPHRTGAVSHVAINLGNGEIVGTNNGVIGGAPNWSRTAVSDNMRFVDGEIVANRDGRKFEMFTIPFDPAPQKQSKRARLKQKIGCVIM